MKFHEIWWDFWKSTQISVLWAPWSARLLNPCFFLREIKVSWRVADGWKHKTSWISLKTNKFLWIPWNFMKIHEFHTFSPISPVFSPAALARKKDSNSYGFSMVAARTFLPGHPKIWFFMIILVSNQFFGNFHETWWNLAPELGFKDSEGSLAGPGWKP